MIIDTHGHLVPPDFLTTLRKEAGRMPALRLIEGDAGLALSFGGGKPSRPVMKGLGDISGRMAWMLTSAAPISLPTSIRPVVSIVTWTCIGSRTSASRIAAG